MRQGRGKLHGLQSDRVYFGIQRAEHTAMTNVHRGFTSTLQLTHRLLKTDGTDSTVSAQAHAVSNRLSKLSFCFVFKN